MSINMGSSEHIMSTERTPYSAAPFAFPHAKCFILAPALQVKYIEMSRTEAYILSFMIFYSSGGCLLMSKKIKAHLFGAIPFPLSGRSYERCVRALKDRRLITFIHSESRNRLGGHYALNVSLIRTFGGMTDGYEVMWKPMTTVGSSRVKEKRNLSTTVAKV